METKTEFTSWDGTVYQGLGNLYQQLQQDEYQEYTADLDSTELLRLALFAWNGNWSLVPEDLWLLIPQENDAFWGEYKTEAEFAEEKSRELDLIDEQATKNLVIDWQATYNYSWQYDFFNYDIIDSDGNYRRFFWQNN